MKYFGAMLTGEFEKIERSENAGFQRVDRIGLICSRRGRTSQIVDLIEASSDCERLSDIALLEAELSGAIKLFNIRAEAGDKAVDTNNMVAVTQQTRAKM